MTDAVTPTPTPDPVPVPVGPAEVTVAWCQARMAELQSDLVAKEAELARAQAAVDQAGQLLNDLTTIATTAGITGLLTQ